eukprot:8399185-Alexandrium_andersonii.AAC.1
MSETNSHVARNDDSHGAKRCDTSVQAPTRAQQRDVGKHADEPVWPAPGTRPAPHAVHCQDFSAGRQG